MSPKAMPQNHRRNSRNSDAAPYGSGEGTPSWRPAAIAVALGLAAVTAIAYSGLAANGFIHYDDDKYVLNNYQVQSGLTPDGLRWAFTSPYEFNWHPLTWISHMADVSCFADRPLGHHMVNLALHIANTLLLFGLLRYTTRRLWPCALVAAFFALHPLHVQSVAWVAERKDVLSTFFWLAAMWMYAAYARKPGGIRYACVLLLFALGLMSKPMLVTLPLVLLLMDWWPLQRPMAAWRDIRWLLAEKVPLLVLAMLSAAVTITVQAGAMPNAQRVDIWMRITNGLVSYLRYIGEMLWPADLAIFYPYPAVAMYWQAAVSLVLLTGISVLAAYLARRYRYLAAGWFWYLITLLPVIGFIQVGDQSHADRYTYVPLIGLFIIIAWAAGDMVAARPVYRPLIALAGVAILVACSAVTWRQVGYWKDDLSIFCRAVSVTRNNYWMLAQYGASLLNAGQVDKAGGVLQEALKLKPGNANALCNMGVALYKQGRLEEALVDFNAAIAARPTMREAYINAGEILAKFGRNDESIEMLRNVLTMDPYNTQAYILLGGVLRNSGRLSDSLEVMKKAAAISPNSSMAHYSLGVLLAETGSTSLAIEHLNRAMALDPSNAEAVDYLHKLTGGLQKP
jgi:protein O-mannosyl-transferase